MADHLVNSLTFVGVCMCVATCRDSWTKYWNNCAPSMTCHVQKKLKWRLPKCLKLSKLTDWKHQPSITAMSSTQRKLRQFLIGFGQAEDMDFLTRQLIHGQRFKWTPVNPCRHASPSIFSKQIKRSSAKKQTKRRVMYREQSIQKREKIYVIQYLEKRRCEWGVICLFGIFL